MKSLLLIFTLFSNILIGQEIEFKEYSYTQLFQMIEEEQDTVFELKDALIKYDQKKDTLFASLTHGFGDPTIRKDTIYIDKEIVFNNVHFPFTQFDKNRFFDTIGILSYMVFEKDVSFNNSIANRIHHCKFLGRVMIVWDQSIPIIHNRLIERQGNNDFFIFQFTQCEFQEGMFFSNMQSNENLQLWFLINNSIFGLKNDKISNSYIQCRNQTGLELRDNIFLGQGRVGVTGLAEEELRIDRNDFGNRSISIQCPQKNIPILSITKNHFNDFVFLTLVDGPKNYTIGWEQFSNKIISDNSYTYLFRDWENLGYDTLIEYVPNTDFRDSTNNEFYFNQAREEISSVYREEAKLLGTFHQMYKQQYDTYSANAVYNELKELETRHFGYIYSQDPTFKGFFTWKVNQFLKVFSAYGTEPARAIVYSVYVILFFGFIYLFFPNTWDSHGRNRIIDRYTFFMKYMRRKAGIHEVYMEDKKEELLTYEKFKEFVKSSEHEVPKIFTATALPLYKWAVSGTLLSSALLKRVDIMKGTWKELPQSKRWWKGILLTGAFSVAIIYDLIIKMLNALMLSINTFTTLGFGEIPIKGLPRYLAIIQGFIGWFMLTIFSVSLISQLLN